MKIVSSKTARRAGGFTLIELMAVMAILIVLAAVSLPAISQISSSMKLTLATQKVVEELQQARSTALARNYPVEVWFLRDSADLSDPTVYKAMRTAIRVGTQKPAWVSRMQRLPDGVGLMSTTAQSSIIGNQTAGSLPNPLNSPSSLSGVAVRFYPSGRVELESSSMPAGQLYFVTLAAIRDFKASGVPSNFATIQVNPVNGRVTTYRP